MILQGNILHITQYRRFFFPFCCFWYKNMVYLSQSLWLMKRWASERLPRQLHRLFIIVMFSDWKLSTDETAIIVINWWSFTVLFLNIWMINAEDLVLSKFSTLESINTITDDICTCFKFQCHFLVNRIQFCYRAKFWHELFLVLTSIYHISSLKVKISVLFPVISFSV